MTDWKRVIFAGLIIIFIIILIILIVPNNNKCYNGGEKHHFVARYSEVESIDFELEGNISPESLRKLMYYNVYEKDVCTWCGKEIKK